MELFSESDWITTDKSNFLKKKFNLLTYEQIAYLKIGDLEKSDEMQNMLDKLLEPNENNDKIGELKSFYAIGKLEIQSTTAKKIWLFNKTLLSMLKNRFCSGILKKHKKITNMGESNF